jgi:hypothetical protein
MVAKAYSRALRPAKDLAFGQDIVPEAANLCVKSQSLHQTVHHFFL